MRSLILLLFIISFCNCATAQLSADEKAVIHIAKGSGYHNHDFCYEYAGIPPWVVEGTSNLIKTDTSLHLSAAEIVEVIDKMHAAEYAQNWQCRTLDSAVVVKESAIKLTGGGNLEDYIKKKYPNIPYYSLYQFSIPIFIRNNSICFLYIIDFGFCYDDPVYKSKICPYADSIEMYVKKNNIWYRRRPWIFIANHD